MRLIDAEFLTELIAIRVEPDKPELVNETFLLIVYLLKAMPTIDAEPVVRCEDCENWKKTEIDWGICLDSADAYHEPMRRYDDFCSYGDREDGE
jgi:hypothetical protein